MATCPSTPSPQFLLLSMKLGSIKYLFGQFGSAVQVVSTPALLSTLVYLLAGRVGVKRQSLDGLQVLLNSGGNIGVFINI